MTRLKQLWTKEIAKDHAMIRNMMIQVIMIITGAVKRVAVKDVKTTLRKSVVTWMPTPLWVSFVYSYFSALKLIFNAEPGPATCNATYSPRPPSATKIDLST